MKWMNALGLLLQFVAFWLVAPEIIGDTRLQRMQVLLKNMISNLSIILLTVIMAGYAVTFAIGGIVKGMQASSTGISQTELIQFYVVLFFATLIYAVIIFKFKKIKEWIDQKMATPIIEKYIQSNRLRSNSLMAGALLFTFGFLIQFIIILREA